MKLTELVSDAGLDSCRTITMDRFPLGSSIQATLKLWEQLGGFVFFSCCDEGDQLFLSSTGMIQKEPIDRPTAQRTPGLFCSRSSVCHKGKQCLNPLPLVNP